MDGTPPGADELNATPQVVSATPTLSERAVALL